MIITSVYNLGYIDVYYEYSQDYPEYRKFPVKGTGNKWRYRFYRKIKTTQERKMWHSIPKEYKIHARLKRSSSMLPNSWDDINRCTQKNWKSFRKTQYKKDTPNFKILNKKYIDKENLICQ